MPDFLAEGRCSSEGCIIVVCYLASDQHIDTGSNQMSDVNGDTGSDLSTVYRALQRRRDEVIAQRDRATDELDKLETVLEAMRALGNMVPEPAAANGEQAPSPASEVASPAAPVTRHADRPAARTAIAADRKTRVIEFLLEHPRTWFISSDIAKRTEEGPLSETQRNGVSETLRRLVRRGCVERDETAKPVRYKAIPAALRELLLAAEE
jgi:hypothetical protein